MVSARTGQVLSSSWVERCDKLSVTLSAEIPVDNSSLSNPSQTIKSIFLTADDLILSSSSRKLLLIHHREPGNFRIVLGSGEGAGFCPSSRMRLQWSEYECTIDDRRLLLAS
jgi:hypothetical protein